MCAKIVRRSLKPCPRLQGPPILEPDATKTFWLVVCGTLLDPELMPIVSNTLTHTTTKHTCSQSSMWNIMCSAHTRIRRIISFTTLHTVPGSSIDLCRRAFAWLRSARSCLVCVPVCVFSFTNWRYPSFTRFSCHTVWTGITLINCVYTCTRNNATDDARARMWMPSVSVCVCVWSGKHYAFEGSIWYWKAWTIGKPGGVR